MPINVKTNPFSLLQLKQEFCDSLDYQVLFGIVFVHVSDEVVGSPYKLIAKVLVLKIP